MIVVAWSNCSRRVESGLVLLPHGLARGEVMAVAGSILEVTLFKLVFVVHASFP